MFPKALVQHAIDCEVCIYRRHCTVQPHLTFLQLFGSNFRKMESKTDYFKSSRQSNKNSAFYKLMNVLCHAVSAVVAGYLSLLCSSSPSFYDSDTSPGSWLQTALLLTYWLWFFAIGRLFGVPSLPSSGCPNRSSLSMRSPPIGSPLITIPSTWTLCLRWMRDVPSKSQRSRRLVSS